MSSTKAHLTWYQSQILQQDSCGFHLTTSIKQFGPLPQETNIKREREWKMDMDVHPIWKQLGLVVKLIDVRSHWSVHEYFVQKNKPTNNN